MTPDYFQWITVALSIISFASTLVIGFLYNRLDARYVQMTAFAQFQDSLKGDHVERNEKLTRIESDISLIKVDLAYLRGVERGIEKGKSRK